MNPGKINPKDPSGVDRAVEILNQKIARALGKNRKNGQNPSPKETSNLTFSLLIIACSIILWFTTGFYYLGDNEYGLILQKGEVTKVVKGMKVGFTNPYPFGDIEVVSALASNFIELSELYQNQPVILSRDLFMVNVDAKFTYEIYDPKVFFESVLHKEDNMDTFVSIEVQNELRTYFSKQIESEILKSNLTVVAGDIKNNINNNLSRYGIKVVKLNINSIKEFENIKPVDDSVNSTITSTESVQNIIESKYPTIQTTGRQVDRSVNRNQNINLDNYVPEQTRGEQNNGF